MQYLICNKGLHYTGGRGVLNFFMEGRGQPNKIDKFYNYLEKIALLMMPLSTRLIMQWIIM